MSILNMLIIDIFTLIFCSIEVPPCLNTTDHFIVKKAASPIGKKGRGGGKRFFYWYFRPIKIQTDFLCNSM